MTPDLISAIWMAQEIERLHRIIAEKDAMILRLARSINKETTMILELVEPSKIQEAIEQTG